MDKPQGEPKPEPQTIEMVDIRSDPTLLNLIMVALLARSGGAQTFHFEDLVEISKDYKDIKTGLDLKGKTFYLRIVTREKT